MKEMTQEECLSYLVEEFNFENQSKTTGADMKKAGRIRSESVRNSLKKGSSSVRVPKHEKTGFGIYGKTLCFFDRLIWKGCAKKMPMETTSG